MTLLELLLALAILAIVIVPFFDRFIKSVEIGQRQEWQVQADLIAQRTLESVKLNPTEITKESGSSGTFEMDRDGFDVDVVWTNKSSDVGLTGESLSFVDLEASTTFHGTLYVEKAANPDTGMDIEVASKKSVQGFSDPQQVLLIIKNGPGANQYEIAHQTIGGEVADGTVTITSGEINLKVDVSDLAGSEPVAGTKVIVRSTVADRTVQVYEFDDAKGHVALSRDSGSTGVVYFIPGLKGSDKISDDVTQTVKYYEVVITVKRNENVLTVLHGSLRSD